MCPSAHQLFLNVLKWQKLIGSIVVVHSCWIPNILRSCGNRISTHLRPRSIRKPWGHLERFVRIGSRRELTSWNQLAQKPAWYVNVFFNSLGWLGRLLFSLLTRWRSGRDWFFILHTFRNRRARSGSTSSEMGNCYLCIWTWRTLLVFRNLSVAHFNFKIQAQYQPQLVVYSHLQVTWQLRKV